MTSKRPSSKQLAEFDSFWDVCSAPYLKRGCTKEDMLEHYVWLWQGAGCPRRFIPKPLDCDRQEVTTGTSNNHDQELCPNRKWTL